MFKQTKAKINLCLHVKGRTTDNYHELQSIVAFCDVGDVVQVEPAEDLSLIVTGEFATHMPPLDENIVLKAAYALQNYKGQNYKGQNHEERSYARGFAGARILLQKNLPASSGIGGGSGDASATLQLLNTLWNCGLSHAQLAQIGLQLGADLPVCLYGKLCLMSGIGEVITPLTFGCDTIYAVLINPLMGVSTADVFSKLQNYSGAINLPEDLPADLLQTLQHNRNDLQATAIKLCPEIAIIIDYMQAQPQTLLARMSGSGATCFALCANATEAQELLQQARRQFPNYWLATGKLS